ncbi:MAG: tetratricopeptide repeat protein [Proteobacteria bacterium]|nr:tetratricopeptide repeat protein [Pseudomonadota bacterium]
MSGTQIKSMIVSSLIITLAMVVFSPFLFAVIKAPTKRDIRHQEVDLKDRLEKPIRSAINKQFLALSVKLLYVEQKQPILSKGAQSKRFKLPGFESRVTLSKKEDGISGYVNVFERYRNITLLVNEPLSKSVESSLEDLLREESDFQINKNDSFDVVIVAGALNRLASKSKKSEQDEEEEGTERKAKKMEKKQQKQRQEFAEMFPDLEDPPENIDPRKEAESSKHLIKSRTAFFNNDLDLALNEVIEAININAYSSKSYEMLGSIYYRLKWYQLALDNWNKALILDPKNRKLNKFISKVKTEL